MNRLLSYLRYIIFHNNLLILWKSLEVGASTIHRRLQGLYHAMACHTFLKTTTDSRFMWIIEVFHWEDNTLNRVLIASVNWGGLYKIKDIFVAIQDRNWEWLVEWVSYLCKIAHHAYNVRSGPEGGFGSEREGYWLTDANDLGICSVSCGFHARLPDCYTLWNIKAVRILPSMLRKVDNVLYIIIYILLWLAGIYILLIKLSSIWCSKASNSIGIAAKGFCVVQY